MKNVVALVSQKEIDEYVFALWRTDIFRDSHEHEGFVHAIVEKFSRMPRLFFENSDDRLERAHFSTWWGAMSHRKDYANPAISDLYWLHEIYHAATMPYLANISWGGFSEKMARNELDASVTSEIQVYFELPELRAASFSHPIYADRFLDDPAMRSLWKHNRDVAIETLREARRDVNHKPIHEVDEIERWIRGFADQNTAYAAVWRLRYPAIEKHMAAMQTETYEKGRKSALDRHRAWLEEEASRDPIDNIPFREAAEELAPFYWRMKRDHQAAMRKIETGADA